MDNPAIALGWFFVFVFSVTIHEAAHAWTAARGGDLTAYSAGQVSLNPIPHMRREPFGMLLFPIVSILLLGWPLGYASAPFDPVWAERHHKRAAIMALAGPVSNLLLAAICFLVMLVGLKAGMFYFTDQPFIQVVTAEDGSMLQGLSLLLGMMLFMNLLLFVLNIMPVPPLDGSAVLPLFMNSGQATRYSRFINSPALGLIGMLVVILLIQYIYFPFHFIVLGILFSMAG